MQSRVTRIASVLVVLLAAALRFHDITRWSLNNDEIAEIRWTSGSAAQMIHLVSDDAVHPPLDYFVQYAITHVHLTEWVHRVPAALFGTASVALVIFLGTLWFGPLAAVAAGFFMALAPMHVRYSQEVRPYSMAIFFVCASLAALEWYARTKERRWAASWFVCVFAAGATLYFAGMVAGVTSLFRIFVARRDELRDLWRRLPLIVLACIVLYSPWLIVVIRLGRTQTVKRDVLEWDWWKYRLQTFATGDFVWEPVSFGSWAFWLCVTIGIVVAIRYRSLATAVFWFVAGTALEIIVLQIHPHAYSVPRYLYPSWPGAVILGGIGIGWLSRSPAGRAVAAFAVLLFAGHAALTLETYFRGERSDWRSVAVYVHDRVKPGETVILTNPWVDRNFRFYWRRLHPEKKVNIVAFVRSSVPWPGPAWVVSGQCQPAATLDARNLMSYSELTDQSRVYYIRHGAALPMHVEVCPE